MSGKDGADSAGLAGPAAAAGPPGCPGCGLSARLAEGELERIVAEYFGGRTPELAPADEAERRLSVCVSCPDLRVR